MFEKMEIGKFVPLDKSWIIRMGILDLINGHDDIIRFLDNQEDLGEDLVALKRVAKNWNTDKDLDVGESGTLYRFVRFALWKLNKKNNIIRRGTLIDRDICDNPDIINWSISRLLGLDNQTSQWASASVLLGNTERLKDIPEKLRLSYEAVRHWKEQRSRNQCWIPIYDSTIKRQAEAFIMIMNTGFSDFKAEHSEDACFAIIFDLIDPEEASKKFPSIIGHETDRIKEIEEQLERYEKGEIIDSKDHRVVQAIVMRSLIDGKNVHIANKDCVRKSWPKFWEFIDYIKSNV